ncbi:MAG TPA: YbjN domain-containing protein [Acidimicrobiales bacterium]|nr:YbjN domain-containing protein [Acidimicrobiales bacterium]
MIDAARRFLESDGWTLTPVDPTSGVRAALAAEKADDRVLVRAREDAGQIVVYTVCPFDVAPEMRAPVGAFLMRLNWGMPFGNFELHYPTGEIRFRTSMTCADAEITDALVRPLVRANVATMGRYLADIGAVSDGTLPPDLSDALG